MRPCRRIGPDGQYFLEFLISINQRRPGFFDGRTGPLKKGEQPDFWFRGGCTLVIDPETGVIRYIISKSVLNAARLDRQRQFERTGALPSLAATYYGLQGRNPFALLHGDD